MHPFHIRIYIFLKHPCSVAACVINRRVWITLLHYYKFSSRTIDIHIHACPDRQFLDRRIETDIIPRAAYKRSAFFDVITGAAD